MATDPGDLVLDPTCGSGTTAYVSEQWGRRWITIDTSRVALALARTRLMAAKYPYYLLADSSEGVAKEAELTGVFPSPGAPPQDDIKRGFVYKRVPHVTLKSIANNEEIDVIHARYQEQLEPLREKLNAALKQNWQEWEIPREADTKWPAPARKTHEEWWRLRRARQQEIDASIARRADTEYLYDQPYEEGKRIRVSGPFTVESLSPHRVLAPADEERPATERAGEAADTAGDFVTVILDNLRKAGIKGADKSQAIKFDRLEAFPGEQIHATGEYTAAGKPRRVAVAIGPQYGTVGPDHIKEAAKEAVRGIGFDLLVVCGFAFDPHVSEEVRRYGKLSVQVVRMNPDLLMGEELLKKTGAGNLFMVFGEPDVDIRHARWQARSRGARRGCLRPHHAGDPQPFHRGYRLLVYRYGVQRRELLRAPRLLHRRRRALREAEARSAGRGGRGCMGVALLNHQPAVRPPEVGQDCGEGDQSLWG